MFISSFYSYYILELDTCQAWCLSLVACRLLLAACRLSLVILSSKVWFLEALQPHGVILVSAYNFSADQPTV